MLTLRLLCLTLVGSRGYMLTSSWLALRVPAPAPARLAIASPSMGFFDLFKDPAEYEVIQAQQAVDLAEASDVATIVEIKAARLRLAEATAAVGEREQLRAEQREQRKEADARSGAWRDDALVAKMGGSAASGAPPKEQAQVVRSIAELERRARHYTPDPNPRPGGGACAPPCHLTCQPACVLPYSRTRQTSGIQLAEERLDRAVAEVAEASDQRAALNNLRREVSGGASSTGSTSGVWGHVVVCGGMWSYVVVCGRMWWYVVVVKREEG